MLVRQIADSKLAQFVHLIGCPRTGEAMVIDPERDVDRYFDLAARHNCASSPQQIPIFTPTTSRACGRWRRAACSSMRRRRAARSGSTSG